MIFFTSLSPNPKAAPTQLACVQSWLDHGHRAVCVQGYDEDIAASLPGEVCVVRVKPTTAGVQRKPYAALDSILDAFLDTGEEHCAIINGDIEIHDPDGLINASAASGDLVCGKRWDHNGDRAGATQFPSGFDLFVLHRKHAISVPRSMFVIGQTWWDYWLPWSCVQAGHRLTTFFAPVAFHRRHPLNYVNTDWQRMTQHFLWLTHRPVQSIPTRVSGEIHKAINKAIIAP
jgi:hypothetical protein